MSTPGTTAAAMEDTESPAVAIIDTDGPSDPDATGADQTPRRRRVPSRLIAFGVLPVLLLLMAVAAGYLKYLSGTAVDGQVAAISSVRAATEGSVALLSYTPDTAQDKLTGNRDLLTGSFLDAYTSLVNDVVIPGSKQKQISATATVPAASSVSANENHAVVLVFVDQTVVVGKDAPSGTASAVQVTLDKVDNRWLISGFDPK